MGWKGGLDGKDDVKEIAVFVPIEYGAGEEMDFKMPLRSLAWYNRSHIVKHIEQEMYSC